ncbi:hypothetical protein [Yinghuangia soli]|uniref:Uncharacterized protein n=1 Tax=Yinghuangia soli TaxID=2908204 RepID=A0AA41TWE5_9ACTN|nr:hypothetical protein [Yinghuangia soli]MCF2525763.1 hypothetical protein [Yinghuangia soli]
MAVKIRLAGAVIGLSLLGVPAVGAATLPSAAQVGDVGDVVVDSANKRVYYSSGASANQVVSVGFDGRGKTVLDGQFGASGMVLSADGSTLYVALAAGDAISAIDTATLTERARYRLNAHSCPTHLVRTGTDVWFGYGCDAWSGEIGRLDTSVEPAVASYGHQAVDPAKPETDQRRFERAPLLAEGGDGAAARIVASQPHISPVNVRLYRVEGGKLVEDGRENRGGSNLNDLAVAADGRLFYTAAGSQSSVDAFTADREMRSSGAWPTGQSPNSVGTSPDGKWLAMGVRTAGPDKASVFLHAPDASRPPVSLRLPRGERLLERGLAWSEDGKALAIVTQQGQDPTPVVRVVDPAAKRPGPGPWPL